MKEDYGRVSSPALSHINNPVQVDTSAGNQDGMHHRRVGGVDRAGVGSYRGRAACHCLCVERAKSRETTSDEEACCVRSEERRGGKGGRGRGGGRRAG